MSLMTSSDFYWMGEKADTFHQYDGFYFRVYLLFPPGIP